MILPTTLCAGWGFPSQNRRIPAPGGLDSYSQWIFGMALDDEGCLWYGYSLGRLHLVGGISSMEGAGEHGNHRQP